MIDVPIAKSNGIDLEYETFGDPSHPTILLIMGLGAQMIMWDEGICALLVARGHHVVRFDNRDVGRSTWFDDPDTDIGAVVMAALMGDTSKVPYLLTDMAADTVGLLDHLGIEAAHLVAASMGGMIAQTVAIENPDRVLSLTSIMSTTGEPDVGQPSPELTAALLAPRPSDREAAIDAGLEIARAIAYEPYFDEERTLAQTIAAYDRGYNPDGIGRQLCAVVASGSRADGLRKLDLPVLVIHGRADKLVDFTGGERTAELVAGAEFIPVDDMAHDVPQVHWSRFADAISEVTHRAN